ncbi:HNH endonuclease [Kitasatospora sp. NPDC036755]|uniref:HNH endonuclease n=1 Tax=Kitasatospora sp. NPDC036755 TaxID=3154600 RepID=UPI0033F5F06C
MRTRCLDCRGWATRNGRCDEHHRAYEAGCTGQSHSKRKQPLALGGQDVDDNVQVLCKSCHRAKTRRDFGHQRPPF